MYTAPAYICYTRYLVANKTTLNEHRHDILGNLLVLKAVILELGLDVKRYITLTWNAS